MEPIEFRIPIKGYENEYEISNYGNIYSKTKYVKNRGHVGGKKLIAKKGIYVQLHKHSQTKNFTISHLVCQHFNPDFYNLTNEKNYKILHNDGNKENNHINNLKLKILSEPDVATKLIIDNDINPILAKNYVVRLGNHKNKENILQIINKKLNKHWAKMPLFVLSCNNKISASNTVIENKIRLEGKRNITKYSIGEYISILNNDTKTLEFFNSLPTKFNIILKAEDREKINPILNEIFHYNTNGVGYSYLQYTKEDNFKHVNKSFDNSPYPLFTSKDFIEKYDKHFNTPPEIVKESQTITENINITSTKLINNYIPKKYEIVLTEDNEEVIYLETLTMNIYNNIVVCDTKYKDLLLNSNMPVLTKLVHHIKPLKVYFTLKEIADWKGCTVDQLEII